MKSKFFKPFPNSLLAIATSGLISLSPSHFTHAQTSQTHLPSSQAQTSSTVTPVSPTPVASPQVTASITPVNPAVQTSHQTAKPKVCILATGGTIAGVQQNATDGNYRPGVLTIDDVLRSVPVLNTVAEMVSEQICNISSQNMTNAIWLHLADRVNTLLQDPSISGVVITHGTDTLEETAYFLNLVVNSPKPVVLVGAMRPATAMSADGPMNLYSAIKVAADPQAVNRGVLVVMNNEIFTAREVTKTHVSHLNAFRAPGRGPEGEVNMAKVTFFRPAVPMQNQRLTFSLVGVTQLPTVNIVYAHAQMAPELVNASVAAGVQGIVLAGVGDGNAADPVIQALAQAVKGGIAVVRSTRVHSGEVKRNMEVQDDQLGFIAAEDLNPQKARILLMLGLTQTHDPHQLQAYFDRR